MVKTILKEYEMRELSEKDGDVALCLIDADFAEEKNAQIAEADRIAEKNHIRVLVSAPCFEIWFLCHYECSSRQYRNAKNILAELRKYIPNYEKSSSGIFAVTKDKLPEAIRNAETLRKICEEKGLTPHTVAFAPSTEADVFAKHLMSDSTMPQSAKS